AGAGNSFTPYFTHPSARSSDDPPAHAAVATTIPMTAATSAATTPSSDIARAIANPTPPPSAPQMMIAMTLRAICRYLRMTASFRRRLRETASAQYKQPFDCQRRIPTVSARSPEPAIARHAVTALFGSQIREVANAGLGDRDVLAFWFGEPDQ